MKTFYYKTDVIEPILLTTIHDDDDFPFDDDYDDDDYPAASINQLLIAFLIIGVILGVWYLWNKKNDNN